jgi:hypothetical protein
MKAWDDFNFVDTITEGLELLIDAIKAGVLSWVKHKDFVIKKFLSFFGLAEDPETKEMKETEAKKEEKRIKKDERVKELIDQGLTSGEAHKRTRAELSVEKGGVKLPMDDAAKLEKSLAFHKKLLEQSAPSDEAWWRSAKQTKEEASFASMEQRRSIASAITVMEAKKAELDAKLKAGGGASVGVANVDASRKSVHQENTHMSTNIIDSELAQVSAVNP